jgi:hypothetical protein
MNSSTYCSLIPACLEKTENFPKSLSVKCVHYYQTLILDLLYLFATNTLSPTLILNLLRTSENADREVLFSTTSNKSLPQAGAFQHSFTIL